MQSAPEVRTDPGGPSAAEPTTRREHRIGLGLLLGVGVLAFVLRARYIDLHPPLLFAGNDDTWYHAVARSFAEGDWGRVPGTNGGTVFSARFPPGFPLVLAVGQRVLFWMEPFRAHLWTSVALGTAGAVLTTALAWRLAVRASLGVRIVATVVTGVLIAANPLVVGAASALMSEVLYLPLVAAFLLLVDVATTTAVRTRTWIALGAVLVAAAFTRGEGLLLLGVPTLALALLHRRTRLVRNGLLAALGAAVLVAFAWSAVLSASAGRPVVMSTNGGGLLYAANCETSLHGDGRGSWDLDCPPIPDDQLSPELRRARATKFRSAFALAPSSGSCSTPSSSAAQLRETLDRIADDPGPSITAIPFRWARGLGVITGSFEAKLTDFEGRDRDAEHSGHLLQQIVILPLVGVLLVALAWRRSRLGAALRDTVVLGRLVPSALLVGAWLVMIAGTYGSARFRQPVEPVFAIVCGLAVAAVVGCFRRPTVRPGR